MAKFNWNRFYNELEEGDPQKFPYWIWFVHELGDIFAGLMTGFIQAIVLIVIIGAFIQVFANYYPDWTFAILRHAVCTQQ